MFSTTLLIAVLGIILIILVHLLSKYTSKTRERFDIDEQHLDNPNEPSLLADPQSSPTNSTNYVKLYEHCDFIGTEYQLEEGWYDSDKLRQKELDGKKVSSIVLGPKTVVEIYNKDSFQGDRWRMVNSTNIENKNNECFTSKWSKGLQSIKVISYDEHLVQQGSYALISTKCGLFDTKDDKTVRLADGKYLFKDLIGIDLDKKPIEGIRAGPKSVVEIYLLDNLQGIPIRIVNSSENGEKGIECLERYNLGNRVASIRVLSLDRYDENTTIPGAILYEKCDKKGQELLLTEGIYNKTDIPLKTISSAIVNPNTIIELYTRERFRGYFWRIENRSETEPLNENCILINVKRSYKFMNKMDNEEDDEEEEQEMYRKKLGRIRSIKIMRSDEHQTKTKITATIYQNCGAGGTKRVLLVGRYTNEDLKNSGITRVLGIRLEPKTVVKLYSKDRMGGEMRTIINESEMDTKFEKCLANKIDVKSLEIMSLEDHRAKQ